MGAWTTVVPVNPGYYDRPRVFATGIQFGQGFTLGAFPEWVKDQQITRDLSVRQRDYVVGEATGAFVAEYDADSLGDPDPAWKGDEPRGKQDVALERILLSNLALWIAKPSHIGGELYLHVHTTNGEHIVRQTSSILGVIPHEKDASNVLDKGDFETARKFYETILALERTEAPWVACRTLLAAISDREWDVRFLLLWIALEALFGSDTEVSFRLAQRIAFFNATEKTETKALFETVKWAYHWRSRIVHGLQIRKLRREESSEVLYDTESIARRSMTKLLSDRTIVEKFSEKNRTDYLDGLVFA